MKKLVGIMTLILLLFAVNAYSRAIDLEHNATLDIFFSPNGSTTDNIVEAINQAKKTIHVQAYSFTSKPIMNALLDAADRKVSVELILDKTNFDNKNIGNVKLFINKNIQVYNDYKPRIAHNKVILIDGEYVITGSFNFSHNAEHNNAENCLIIHSENLVWVMEQNYQYRKTLSKIYTGK